MYTRYTHPGIHHREVYTTVTHPVYTTGAYTPLLYTRVYPREAIYLSIPRVYPPREAIHLPIYTLRYTQGGYTPYIHPEVYPGR